jgi:hypothetical protein
MLQAPAFTGMPAAWWSATAMSARATVGDGVIVLAVFAVGALAFRDWCWFAPPAIARYAAVVLFGVILQVVIEWVMVRRLGRWGYQPWDPVVPVFGVGVPAHPVARRALPLVFWGLACIEPGAGHASRDSRRRSPGKSP